MKTFVQFNKNKSKYKIGDVVYYHGMHRNARGYYVIKNYYCSNDQNMWKYDLESLNKNTVQLSYIWEISLSKTKEEFQENQRIKSEKYKDIDPYGEEEWE